MPININLKEIFSADSAGDIANKLNFNFNQLLALGIGETGPAGPIGQTGLAGPVGPVGPQGETGSQIYSGTSGQSDDLTSVLPNSTRIGDYFIGEVSGSYKIWKKIDSTNTWNSTINISQLISDAAASNSQIGWQLGVESNSNSRLLIPKNFSGNIDRITVSGTSGNSNPNWADPSETKQNSQEVILNFDPNAAFIFSTSGTVNSSGYNVTTTSATSSLNASIPYTALLSLYSFYNNSTVTTDASGFDTTTGHRHQLELGSVDDIPEPFVDGGVNYVISPTHQNLRIKKYRIQASMVGGAALFADYNLHSTDDQYQPAINSRQAWTINKKNTLAAGSVIKMALSTGYLEATIASQQKITGLPIDGIHISSTQNSQKLAIGLWANNDGASNKRLMIMSDGSLDTMYVDKFKLIISNSSLNTITIQPTQISSTTSLIINANPSIQVIGSVSATMSSGSGGTTVSSTGNINITTLNDILIGGATPAIRVTGSRLSSAIPFADSGGPVPAKNSADRNTLDEYQEGTFTPVIDWTLGGAEPFNPAAGIVTPPTITNQSGYYTKIGNLIHFVIRFRLQGFRLVNTAYQVTTGGGLSTLSQLTQLIPTSAVTGGIGNISTSGASGATITAGSMVALGAERNRLRITGLEALPGWPAGTLGSNMTDLIKFPVSLSSSKNNGGNPAYSLLVRSFPFHFSVGGTTTSGTSSSTSGFINPNDGAYMPIDPSSICAMFQAISNPSGSTASLELFGFRRRYYGTAGSSVTSGNMSQISAVSPYQSRVTIWDFLNYYSADSTMNWINFTINGSYLTEHKPVSTVYGTSGSGA